MAHLASNPDLYRMREGPGFEAMAHYNQDSVILEAIWPELQINKAKENQLQQVPGF